MDKILIIFLLFWHILLSLISDNIYYVNGFELIQKEDTTHLIQIGSKDYPYIPDRIISADLHWKYCIPSSEEIHMTELISAQHTIKEDSLIIYFQNNSEDTVLLFGTLIKKNLFYNFDYLKKEKNKIVVDLSAQKDPPILYSGMRSFQFYVIPPKCKIQFEISLPIISQMLNIDMKDSIEHEVLFSYLNINDIIMHFMDDKNIHGYSYNRRGKLIKTTSILLK